jgi:Tfp pilus assembly protein PilF
VLKLDPNNVDANTRLALIYDLRDRNKDADAAARKAIAADPKAAFAHAILAESLNNQGEYKAALYGPRIFETLQQFRDGARATPLPGTDAPRRPAKRASGL